MTPAEVRFALDAKLVAQAEGGRVPTITGVHSVHVEGDTVSVGYDLLPEGLLFFEFQRPALVARDEVHDFSAWLAWAGHGATMH
jgi:hypothetical protein